LTKRITLEERAAQIAAKLEAGVRRPPADALRNSGRRRTPAKKMLLARIASAKDGD